jgi:hypothetical protein
MKLTSYSSAFDIEWNKMFLGKANRDMQARLQALFLKTD